MFDANLTKHLAELSKLEFSDSELERVTSEMSEIIELMDRVKDIDPSEKVYTLSGVDFDSLRPDCAAPSLETEKIIANAKAVKDNTFTVPKVV